MTKMLPRLTVRLQGVTQNIAPQPKEAGPRLTIRLNGIVRSIIPLPSRQVQDEPSDALVNAANSDSQGPSLDDVDDSDEDGELLKQVDQYLHNDIEHETEDAPDWLLDSGETLAADSDYVFCPAAHRRQVLHLFTRHFCLHPIFPERDGTWASAEEIRSMRCISFALYVGYEKSGVICGLVGIHQRCGGCGHNQQHNTFLGCVRL